jgi:hypothetical protein
MSTTFEVFPGSSRLPSFGEVTEKTRDRLRNFLFDFGISARPDITVNLMRKMNDEKQPVFPDDPLKWDIDYYAWFCIPSIAGGTDAYFNKIEPIDLEVEEGEEADKRIILLRSLQPDYYWVFRRSMGQPAIINLLYGLLAATTAELTEGFVFSDDSAWDYQLLPAKPDDFFRWYFRPSLAISPEFKEWAERCIRYIPKELGVKKHGAGEYR